MRWQKSAACYSPSADHASYELLKGIRWILVRRREELKPEEEAKLRAALDAFPELRTAYLLKERFVAIADKIQDRSQPNASCGHGCMSFSPLG